MLCYNLLLAVNAAAVPAGLLNPSSVFAMTALSLLIAALSHFLQKCYEPGMFLHRYYIRVQAASRYLEKGRHGRYTHKGKRLAFWLKPLYCIYCQSADLALIAGLWCF